MAKYHINPKTGNAGICRAQAGGCPFGGDDEHYSTREEALTAYGARAQELPQSLKRGETSSAPEARRELVPLREAAHILGQQVQYVSRYLQREDGLFDRDLEITELPRDGNYHALEIAREDVVPFVARILSHQQSVGVIGTEEVDSKCQRLAAYWATFDGRAKVLLEEGPWSLSPEGWSTLEGGEAMDLRSAFALQSMRGFIRATANELREAKALQESSG